MVKLVPELAVVILDGLPAYRQVHAVCN
jgi:hypothetical protein